MQASGKTVLITGGGSGIGLDIAKAFLNEGSKVIICGRNLTKLQAVKEQNPSLEIAQCDVTNDEQIQTLLDRCNNDFGGIDILVNNAGVFHEFNIVKDQFPLESQLKEIDIDLGGPVRMVYYFLPTLLKKPEAAIVNVSSGLAFIPFVIGPVYSSTKAALHSWSLSLRKQLSETNVKVFELMPPVVDTDMTTTIEGIPKMTPERHASIFMKGFLNDKLEITPGLSLGLKVMSRIAPNLFLNLLNR